MNFVRKVANSNILASIIDIPENLRNKKVEILIFPYENLDSEAIIDQKPKRVYAYYKIGKHDVYTFENEEVYKRTGSNCIISYSLAE